MAYLLRQPHGYIYPTFVAYQSLFSHEECQRIIDMQKTLGMKTADTEDIKADDLSTLKNIRSAKVGWIAWSQKSEWIYAKLSAVCDDVRQHWYPFHLSGFLDDLQLTHYRAQDAGHYRMHKDMGQKDTVCRKLSMVVLLSDPESFEGGALEMMASKNQPKLERGTLIAFPAWELHQVTPITKGERFSLVAWASGPAFV